MRKKLLALILVLVVLGGGSAVLIGYYLSQQTVSPEDTEAKTTECEWPKVQVCAGQTKFRCSRCNGVTTGGCDNPDWWL